MSAYDVTMDEKPSDSADKHAVKVESLWGFRSELKHAQDTWRDELQLVAIESLYPALENYEMFARSFVALTGRRIDVPAMWNLLFLVIKGALEGVDTYPVRLRCITERLENIGQNTRTANHLSKDVINSQSAAMNMEIAENWFDVITASIDLREESDDNPMKDLTGKNALAYEVVCEADSNIIKEIEERLRRTLTKISSRYISSTESSQDGVTLPCHTLPVAENRLFFGQERVLEQLDSRLTPRNAPNRLSSVVLHGLGGIGKTQIALTYAHQRLKDFDAVFWISAENLNTIEGSFARAAIDALKIGNVKAQDEDNMALALDWLRNTSARWLVIFDNFIHSDHILVKCWPVSSHGAIIVTTRDGIINTPLIDIGIEVREFDEREGARLLLQMTPNRHRVEDETEAATQVSRALGGLPLAISQMAALINTSNYTIAEFADMYTKYERRLHKERKPGSKYLGYEHALDSVWEESFKALQKEEWALLGVLSFLKCDQLLRQVFSTKTPDKLPGIINFCEDGLRADNALERLVRLGLVGRTTREGSYHIHHIHCLVVKEIRVKMENTQECFEAAIRLLLDKFPSDRANKYDDEEWTIYDTYIPHVLALARNYQDSQSTANPLIPSMDLVGLLVNAANAIHDNDLSNNVPGLLEIASSAFKNLPEKDHDEQMWAFILSVRGMYHLTTAEFAQSEKEMTECLSIRLELLPHDDLLICLAYSWLGMAVGGQGRYKEGLNLLWKAGKVLDGPAGKIPTRRHVWRYNIARNYYCMGEYKEAEGLLREALDEADGWYQRVYGHLTFASLWTRMGKLEHAKDAVDKASKIIEQYGEPAKRSWLSSYCAYRAGIVAMRQGRIKDAIINTREAVIHGKNAKVPIGILSRCTHAFSQALAMDSAWIKESEEQREEARQLRLKMPGGSGDLDDESDEAFEKLVKMDHR